MDLTIALERYDRHFPFFDGTVKPPKGINLKTMQVGQSAPARDGLDRHGRMLKGEFDLAEFSMSTYLMAIDRKLPITGIPVFPRRLFSAGLFFVRADSPLQTPADLKGKRVAIRAFQNTLAMLAKGDLKFEYGVPWEDIHWLREDEEKIDFTPRPGLKIETLPKGTDVGHLLRDGKADAVIQPHPPDSIMLGEVPVRRLFADADAEELRYFKKLGYFPIMHILAIKKDLAEKEPSLPGAHDGNVWGGTRAGRGIFLRSELVEPRFRAALFRAREADVRRRHLAHGSCRQSQEPRTLHDVFARPGPDQRGLRSRGPVRAFGAGDIRTPNNQAAAEVSFRPAVTSWP